MSRVSESKRWCDITAAENALGIDSQPLTTASPLFQISLSLFARTAGSSRPRPLPGPGHRGLYAPWPPSLWQPLQHEMAAVARVPAHRPRPAPPADSLGE